MELGEAFFCLLLCPITLDSRDVWYQSQSKGERGEGSAWRLQSHIAPPAKRGIAGDPSGASGV